MSSTKLSPNLWPTTQTLIEKYHFKETGRFHGGQTDPLWDSNFPRNGPFHEAIKKSRNAH
jgi:hypothetical protein